MKFKILASVAPLAIAGSMTISAPAQAQADPFIGQLMLFGGNFCPRGWGEASGSLLPISQNTALFSIFGTMYGGDGRTTFALPDLRGRAPIDQGQGPGLPFYTQGETGGATSFTLTVNQMPSHNHLGTLRASPAVGDSNNPVRNYFAQAPAGTNQFVSGAAPANNMGADALRIANAGGGQAVNFRSPFLAMRWCVALVGIFPSRN